MNSFSDAVYLASPKTKSKQDYWNEYIEHSMTDVQMMSDHMDQYVVDGQGSVRLSHPQQKFEITVGMDNKHVMHVVHFTTISLSPEEMRDFASVDAMIMMCIQNVQAVANGVPDVPIA